VGIEKVVVAEERNTKRISWRIFLVQAKIKTMKLNHQTFILFFHLVFLLMTPAIAFADATDLERLEENEKVEKSLSTLSKVEILLDNMRRDNKTRCLKAFGHELFCNCLSSRFDK
jgi:hypothetical protein